MSANSGVSRKTYSSPRIKKLTPEDAKAALSDRDSNSSARVDGRMPGSEPIFAEFFYSSNAGLAIFDEQMRYRAVNSRLAAINGIPVESHLGKTLREVLGDIALQVESAMKQVMTTGRPVLSLELAGSLPTDVKRRRRVDNLFPMKDANGRVELVGAVVVELCPDTTCEAASTIPEAELLPGSANEMLRSWKDISNYVGACVKTVQRWEENYNFPIRRLERSKGASVFALKAEVDSWILTRIHQARAC
jgi:PAS domain-containing protein